MANPSISVPDELLDEFDGKIKQLKLDEEIDIDTDRSQVIRELMRQWVEGNSTSISNRSKATIAAD